MKSYDWKYIFKKVLIFFIIFVILSFVRSCKVDALSLENKGTSIRFMPNNTYANNLNWSQNYYNGTPHDNYNGFNIFAEVIDNNNLEIIFDGRYLVSFIVFSSVEQNGISCSNLSSNFRNVNITTGNWVQNEISSNCIDTYNTSYYNKPAIRILYEFTYKTRTGPTGITELNFIVNTNNNFFLGGDFGLDYGIAVSDVELYDINIINTWNNDKANQTIINQNNLLYGSLQQQINQQHSDSIAEQNAINNNTNAVNNQTNTINDDNVSGAESQVNDLLNNSSFQDNSGIQSIITAPLNFIQGLTNTCSPISLTIPFINSNVNIPCMKQELTNRVPTLVPILSTIINGFIIYRILIDIVGIVKSAREPDEDRIEVLDL